MAFPLANVTLTCTPGASSPDPPIPFIANAYSSYCLQEIAYRLTDRLTDSSTPGIGMFEWSHSVPRACCTSQCHVAKRSLQWLNVDCFVQTACWSGLKFEPMSPRDTDVVLTTASHISLWCFLDPFVVVPMNSWSPKQLDFSGRPLLTSWDNLSLTSLAV